MKNDNAYDIRSASHSSSYGNGSLWFEVGRLVLDGVCY